MFNNLQINRLSRVALLLLVSMFFSLNSYAVKKSAVGINAKEAQKSSVVKKEKPSLFQRLSTKVLSKKIEKKIAKFKARAEKGEGEKKGMAIAALALGVLSFLVGFIPGIGLIAIPAAICALVFGVIGRKKAKENPGEYGGKGMALAGMILGIVFLGILLLGILFIAALFAL
jgi:hypothetical protein